MDMALRILAALALVALNAAFVAAEFALVAVDRTRVDERANAGNRRARRIQSLVSRLSFHLSGAQIGITITSLLLGFLAEPTVAAVISPLLEIVVDPVPRGVSVGLALAIATVVQMVLGELVPKTVATSKPYGTAVALLLPITVYGVLVKPVVVFFNGVANRMIRKLGIEPKEEIDPTPGRDEFTSLFASSGDEGELDENQVQLLTKAIRLADKKASDAMIPRVEVTVVSDDTTVEDLARIAVTTGHSRFPVTGEDLDDVVGVVHAKAIYSVPMSERSSTMVAQVMSPVLAVPESRALSELLSELRGKDKKESNRSEFDEHDVSTSGQLAVVIDEHGGTAGIITLEDVLEEIVGEIDDEHDLVGSERTRIEVRGSTVLPASLHVDEVLEATGFAMPEGEYVTLAGLVLDHLGHIPALGEKVIVDGWCLEVVAMERLRIATVRVVAPDVALSGNPPVSPKSSSPDSSPQIDLLPAASSTDSPTSEK